MGRRTLVSSKGFRTELLESRLLFAIPEPNNTFATAYTPQDNIYLQTLYTPSDSVNTSGDTSDFYKFYNLYGKSNLYAVLNGLSSDADLFVYDQNQNLLNSGTTGGSTSETVITNLPTNEYFYIEVRKFTAGSTNYGLFLQNDYAGSTLATARDLGTSLGQTTDRFDPYNPVGFFEILDYRDTTDIYKFLMEAPGTVSIHRPSATFGGVALATNIQLLDSGGGVLTNSVNSNGVSDIDRFSVPAGTYYAKLQQTDGSGQFNLRIVSDYAGDTVATARDLGNLTNQSRQDIDMVGGPGLPVSFVDNLDLYKFTFDKAAPLDIFMDINETPFPSPTFDADLFLARDTNGNGFISSDEIINTAATTSDDELHFGQLNAGNYIVGVQQHGAYTTYQLDLDSDIDAPNGAAPVTKDMSHAQNFGTLTGNSSFDGGFGISLGDSVDFYKFTLSATGIVRVGAQNGNFYSRNLGLPFVSILKDTNNNVQFDTGEAVAQGAGGATFTLAAGTYYVAINSPGGQSTYFGQITSDYAGQTLPAGRVLAAISGAAPATQTFQDYIEQDFGVGSDPFDFYTFTLPSTYAVTLKTTGVAGEDSALSLIQDVNNNSAIDPGDVLATSDVPDSSNETITRTLAAGKYSIRMAGVNGGTNYTLTAAFSTGGTDDPDDTISDVSNRAANIKNLGEFADFNVDPADDVDLIKFTVGAGQKVGFDLDSRDGSNLNTFLRIFDSAGNQLDSNNDGAAPGEGASGFSYLEHTFATAGTYYAGISNNPNTNYNPNTGGGDVNGSGPLGAYRLFLNNLGINSSFGVTSVSLINAGTDGVVGNLTPGQSINLADFAGGISFRANTNGTIGSVRFTDNNNVVRTENLAPYTIAGENGADILPWNVSVGSHTLVVTPFSGQNASGNAGTALTISYTITNGQAGTAVTDLQLINANTDQSVGSLVNGQQINLANFPISVRAFTSGTVGSVRFFDNGQLVRNENLAPYSIAGDSGSDYAPWNVSVGAHTLVVTSYSGQNGTGAAGTSKTVNFTVTNGAPAGPLRINAGGPQYTTTDGKVFAADTGFSGGSTSTAAYAVANTNDDPLYYDRRFGANFSFSKAVANGNYTLYLNFAESFFTGVGQRKFDVFAEGNQILNDLDLVASAGSKTAYTRSFSVNVIDGKLDLSFVGVVGEAIVSSVALIPA